MNLKFLLPLMLTASLGAQTGVPQKPPIDLSKPIKTETLTELESTKLELETTQNYMIRRQAQELATKHAKTIEDISKNHPGYFYNESVGQLMLIPAPVAPLDPHTGQRVREPTPPPITPQQQKYLDSLTPKEGQEPTPAPEIKKKP